MQVPLKRNPNWSMSLALMRIRRRLVYYVIIKRSHAGELLIIACVRVSEVWLRKSVFHSRIFCPCPDVAVTVPVQPRDLKYARTAALFLSCRTRTYHGAGRHRVPLEPEGNEGRGDQDNSRNEHGREIKCSIPREYQIHLQAAVVP